MKYSLIYIFLFASLVAHAGKNFSTWLDEQTLESGSTLTLPEGVYHAYPDDYGHRYLHITNNDDGIKHIIFDLSGLEDVTIDGNGANLIMHGHIIPFYMNRAKNITIKNLTIDWAHPFYSQAKVIAAGEDWVEVKFEEEYTVQIRKGELVAINPDLKYPVHFNNINYIDPERGEQAYLSRDDYPMLRPENYTVIQKKNGVIRITSSEMWNQPKAGQIAVFQYKGRTSPVIAVQNSSNIRIEGMTQHHSGAIANVFEGSEDLYIDKMIMKPSGNRWFTALNDATHYVDCSGDIFITNSHFEFQGDDATNIHGIYRMVDGAVDDNALRLRLMHHQQLGVDTIHAGDQVALCDRDTLEILAVVTVKETFPHDHQIGVYAFEEPLPDLDWRDVVAMAYLTDVNVKISGNTFQKNRARALLVKTLGRIRIHDNYFHTPGPALNTSYGTRGKWFESGPFDGYEIYNNVFDQCNFGEWGNALFSFGPHQGVPVSKNVTVRNNKMILIQKPIVSVQNLENFEFYENEISTGSDYPFRGESSDSIVLGAGATTGRIEE